MKTEVYLFNLFFDLYADTKNATKRLSRVALLDPEKELIMNI